VTASARRLVSVAVVIGIGLLLPGSARAAGAFHDVYVDGTPASDGGYCNLYQDVYVEGYFTPDSVSAPVLAVDWNLNGGTWYGASFDVVSGDGTVHFYFTMNLLLSPGVNTLNIRATDSGTTTLTFWSCHN